MRGPIYHHHHHHHYNIYYIPGARVYIRVWERAPFLSLSLSALDTRNDVVILADSPAFQRAALYAPMTGRIHKSDVNPILGLSMPVNRPPFASFR